MLVDNLHIYDDTQFLDDTVNKACLTILLWKYYAMLIELFPTRICSIEVNMLCGGFSLLWQYFILKDDCHYLFNNQGLSVSCEVQ